MALGWNVHLWAEKHRWSNKKGKGLEKEAGDRQGVDNKLGPGAQLGLERQKWGLKQRGEPASNAKNTS